LKHYKLFQLSWKISRAALHLVLGIILSLLIIRNGIQGSALSSRVYIWWNVKLCRIFRAQVIVHGNHQPEEATLYVMNHISWIDIPALATQQPLHFLSKAEVRSWPFIGWFAERVGTLFIQRGVAGAASKSLSEITHCLEQGGNVAIFPEGTTTDGTSMRTFHGRLLQAAIDAKIKIQPVALHYPHESGSNPYVRYVGEMSFIDSLFSLTQAKSIDVELHYLQPITLHLQQANNVSRKQLAQLAQQAIARKLKLDNFPEKA